MAHFEYSTHRLTAKIVYYGPALCGKTTNLRFINGKLPDQVKGKMISLATRDDRTLIFDFLPFDLGDVGGLETRVQLYTVPGQVFYNETRKLMLKGTDGIVFVADSQEPMMEANIESLQNLEDNLKEHGYRLADIPHLMQYNKRDLSHLSSIGDLNAALNAHHAPYHASVATTGTGVIETLKDIVGRVLMDLRQKYDRRMAVAAEVR
jgi:hypothetical protein